MSIPTEDQTRAASPPRGAVVNLDENELKVGSSASLTELREFLSQLKGRKPQEVIGIVSASLLVQSMVMAIAIVCGLLVMFTVGPYLVYGPPQPKKAPTATANTAGMTPQPADAMPAQGESPGSMAETSADTPASIEPDLKKGSEVMGLDESKSADPSKNPLDSPDLDKLLDGLDP